MTNPTGISTDAVDALKKKPCTYDPRYMNPLDRVVYWCPECGVLLMAHLKHPNPEGLIESSEGMLKVEKICDRP